MYTNKSKPRLPKHPNLLLNLTTFRTKDLHLFQTLSSIVIFFLDTSLLKEQRILKQPSLNSTTFRAEDLHLFQTLSSIVIFFL